MTSNSVDSVEEPSPDVQATVSAEESHGRREPPKRTPLGERAADMDRNAVSPRSVFLTHICDYCVCDQIDIGNSFDVTRWF